MEHTHDYETIERHAVSAEAREKGLESAETRRCRGCGQEAMFLECHGRWIPLFEESRRTEKDILLA